jgi:predicted RNase H-like HicB family nuclease
MWHSFPVSHTIIIIKSDKLDQIMKTLIEVHKEGKYFVAVDLLTNVADQGSSEEEAVRNLKKGLEEHYQLLIELTPRDHKLTYLDIEVDNLVKNSPAVSS